MNKGQGILGCVLCLLLLADVGRADDGLDHSFTKALASFGAAKTSRSDVTKVLGEPARTSTYRGRESLWYARVRKVSVAASTVRIEDALCVDLVEGVLADYRGYSIVLRTNAARAGTPLAKVQALSVGETTEKDARGKLGLPELRFWERSDSTACCYDVSDGQSKKWTTLTFKSGKLSSLRAAVRSSYRVEPDSRFAERSPPVSSVGIAFMPHRGWGLLLQAVDGLVGDLRLTKEDAAALTRHVQSFHKLSLDQLFMAGAMAASGPDGFRAEAFEIDRLLKNPILLKWAKENGLDPRWWLRRYLRMLSLFVAEPFVTSLVDGGQVLVFWRRQLETADAKKRESHKRRIEGGLDAIRFAQYFRARAMPNATEQELIETTLADLKKALVG